MSGLGDIATIVLVSAGALLFLAGALGLLRFPDTLSRLHAISKADNLGRDDFGVMMIKGFLNGRSIWRRRRRHRQRPRPSAPACSLKPLPGCTTSLPNGASSCWGMVRFVRR